MEQEALEILRMVQEGKVTPEQGAQLLEALKSPASGVSPATGSRPRFVRAVVRVSDEQKKEKVMVNANLPVALADLALKMAESAKITKDGETIVLGDFLKNMGGVDISTILQMVKEGAEGKLVDVTVDGDKGEKVKVEVVVD